MNEVMLIEIGTGVDLQGSDPTKAAQRAVRDAIGRIYLPMFRRLTADGTKRMLVHVRLAAPPQAGPIDTEAVRTSLPHGEVTVEVIPGGMLLPSGLDDDGHICVVIAAIEAGWNRLDKGALTLPKHRLRVCKLEDPATPGQTTST